MAPLIGQAVGEDVRRVIRAGLEATEQNLSGCLDRPITLSPDIMAVVDMNDISQLMAEETGSVVAVYLSFSGDVRGHCVICFSEEAAAELAAQLTGQSEIRDELPRSALLETGNIAVSGFVNGVADICGWSITVTPPVLTRDIFAAVLNTVLASALMEMEEILMVRTHLISQGQRVSGTILFLPDSRSLAALGRGTA